MDSPAIAYAEVRISDVVGEVAEPEGGPAEVLESGRLQTPTTPWIVKSP